MKAPILLLVVPLACAEGLEPSSLSHELAQGPVRDVALQGRAEKGPFVAGSELTLQELEGESLVQTGNSFRGTIYSDLGEYEIRASELAYPIARLSVVGETQSETQSETRERNSLGSELELSGYVPVTSGLGNVNILTHLIAPRIEHLVDDGLSFADARDQAQDELAATFFADDIAMGEFSSLSLHGTSQADSFLLAVSSIFDQLYYFDGSRSAKYARIADDFAQDGAIDFEANVVRSAFQMDLDRVRDNLDAWYGTGNHAARFTFRYLVENFLDNTLRTAGPATYPETTECGDNILAEGVTDITDYEAVATWDDETESQIVVGLWAVTTELGLVDVVIEGLSEGSSCWSWYAPLRHSSFWAHRRCESHTFCARFAAGESEHSFNVLIYENGATTPTRTKTITIHRPS